MKITDFWVGTSCSLVRADDSEDFTDPIIRVQEWL
jgi:diphthamide synthase subunit DPH2